MDSGNSSSMQSSSGGGGGDQEEYDSRADQSFSAFFNQNNNNNTTTTVSSNMAGSTQLDSLIANYFNNTGWSSPDQTPLWSAPKPPDGSSTPIPPQPQPQPQEPVFFTNPLDPSHQQQQQNTNTSRPSCSVPTDKKNGLMPTRNPKKRSRVSRRAPTTVLTTDTSNFRAMVQEFTGNPSTPFNGLSSSSSPFPTRSRFDLFGSSSSSSLPLRPFPHKLINHHQYLPPPSSSDYHLLNINTQNITNPFLNHNQTQTNPLMDQSSLSLRRSNDFGRVETNFEGLQSIMGSSSSSSRTMTTQPTLGIVHGDKTNENVHHHNDMLRSINGEDQATLRRSDGSGSVVRNEGMVELSWISSSD